MAKSQLNALLDAVNQKRLEHADMALSKPREKTEFEYGRVCGYHQAIIEILEISKNLDEEEKERE